MSNLYITVFHPSNALNFHAWSGPNSGGCTANLDRQWTNLSNFNFADIKGQWHLSVQEVMGQTAGYLDYWSIRLYYTDDSTPTPTPTRTATRTPTRTATPTPTATGSTLQRLYLPLIIADL